MWEICRPALISTAAQNKASGLEVRRGCAFARYRHGNKPAFAPLRWRENRIIKEGAEEHLSVLCATERRFSNSVSRGTPCAARAGSRPHLDRGIFFFRAFHFFFLIGSFPVFRRIILPSRATFCQRRRIKCSRPRCV